MTSELAIKVRERIHHEHGQICAIWSFRSWFIIFRSQNSCPWPGRDVARLSRPTVRVQAPHSQEFGQCFINVLLVCDGPRDDAKSSAFCLTEHTRAPAGMPTLE